MSNNAEQVLYTGPLWGNEEGYYFCPLCHYVLADHLLQETDIKHKNYCSNCGCKLDWSKKNTAGAYIDKVQFVADNLAFFVSQIKNCDMMTIDQVIEEYLYAESKADTTKIINKLEKAIEEVE